MVTRFLRLAVLAAPILIASSAKAGHFTCRATLADEDGLKDAETSELRHLTFKLLETSDGVVDVQVGSASDEGEVATGQPFQTKFKNVPIRKTEDGGYQLEATPEQFVGSEPAGCNQRQYFYRFRLTPKGGNFSGDVEITPFYKKGAMNGKCIAFAAPELITESHRGILCLHKD